MIVNSFVVVEVEAPIPVLAYRQSGTNEKNIFILDAPEPTPSVHTDLTSC